MSHAPGVVRHRGSAWAQLNQTTVLPGDPTLLPGSLRGLGRRNNPSATPPLPGGRFRVATDPQSPCGSAAPRLWCQGRTNDSNCYPTSLPAPSPLLPLVSLGWVGSFTWISEAVSLPPAHPPSAFLELSTAPFLHLQDEGDSSLSANGHCQFDSLEAPTTGGLWAQQLCGPAASRASSGAAGRPTPQPRPGSSPGMEAWPPGHRQDAPPSWKPRHARF